MRRRLPPSWLPRSGVAGNRSPGHPPLCPAHLQLFDEPLHGNGMVAVVVALAATASRPQEKVAVPPTGNVPPACATCRWWPNQAITAAAPLQGQIQLHRLWCSNPQNR